MNYRAVLGCAMAIIALVGAACSDSSMDPPPASTLPRIEAVRIDANPLNSLSATVHVRVSGTAEAYLRVTTDSMAAAVSPALPVAGDSLVLPLLGLYPDTRNAIRVTAVSAAGDSVTSDVAMFTSGGLPTALPAISSTFPGGHPDGFTLLGLVSQVADAPGYAVILDTAGRVVWYRAFPSPIVDFQKQSNGHYTAYSSVDGSVPHFYEMDNLGRILDEYAARPGFTTGPHEIRLGEGGYCLFSVEIRDMDLSALGGRADARVRGTGVEWHRPGQPAFFWSPFDHFQVSDAAPDISLRERDVNPWHGNAIDIDKDGHLLVSFRNSDEVAKIIVPTGEVMWRFGGENSDFAVVNDPLNGFSHQHGIRRLENGNIILFDNGNLHSPPESRAVEYALDEQAMTATLVWEYRHSPILYGFALGFAQRLPDGHTLINYGTAQIVLEVNAAGQRVAEYAVDDPDYFVYRAFRVPSLY